MTGGFPAAAAVLLAALVGTGSLLHVAGPGAPEGAGGADLSLPVRQVVLDVISFTRWPEPRPDLRLCVVGQPDHAGGFFTEPLQAGGVPIRVRRAAVGEERLGSACDVVYAGPLPVGERETLGRRIAGYPVLTIGEPAAGCVQATMFCLQFRDALVLFSANVDAIARSGVRLNPRVLLLGRRAPVSP